MKKSIKSWVFEVLLLWPVLVGLLWSVWVTQYNHAIPESIGLFIYYSLTSMIYQFFLYLQNALVLLLLRQIFFRFIVLANKGFVFLFGVLSGTSSYFFCHWLNNSVVRLYENIFEEYYFVFVFALVGGLFFLLGQRRKIKTEAR